MCKDFRYAFLIDNNTVFEIEYKTIVDSPIFTSSCYFFDANKKLVMGGQCQNIISQNCIVGIFLSEFYEYHYMKLDNNQEETLENYLSIFKNSFPYLVTYDKKQFRMKDFRNLLDCSA